LSFTLLILASSWVWAEPPDTVALQVSRVHAALAVEDFEGAALLAAQGLVEGPADWRAWWTWRETLVDLGALEQLRQETLVLVSSSDPWQRWIGTAWTAAQDQRVPIPDPNLVGSALLAARVAMAQGVPDQALKLTLQRTGAAASGLRLAALIDLGQERPALIEARALHRSWPGRIDLLTPICRVDSRGSRSVKRDAVRVAAETLGGEDILAIYRSQDFLSGCGETALAIAASARLVALGEPYTLGGHVPWGGAMVRDLGRILAMQRSPTLPDGGTAQEAQRVLVATARELQERGRPEDSLLLWRQAMALCEPPAEIALESAEIELSRGDKERALNQARQARQSLSLAALDPGEEVQHGLRLARSWRIEALVLRSQSQPDGALQAAALAASTAGRARDLVLWGEILEQAGESRAALQAYGHAAALGHRGLEPRMERLYDGPATAEVVVASWRESLDEDPRSRAVQEDRGARVPSRTLATTAGPLRIGDSEGQWMVLNFWASWCGPCQLELPELARLSELVEQEGLPVRIVAISLDDRRGDYEHWIENRETGGLVLAWDPDLGRALHLKSVPTTLLVDPQGMVQETRRGYKPGDGERMLDELRPHLESTAEE
jgi:thiol-disulfide isomerase/thioredoxin/tetratricopeptide (TPR) repeat protein